MQRNKRAPQRQKAELSPYDHVNQWKPGAAGDLTLSAFQKAFVLSAFPAGSHISRLGYAGDRNRSPVLVTVVPPHGMESAVLLRNSRLLDGVETEARVLPVLLGLGLPVPEVLAGPAYDPDAPEIGGLSLLSCLPGNDLQNLSSPSAVGVDEASRLVLEAVGRLHQLTEQLPWATTGHLVRRDLLTQLRSIVERGGAWLRQPLFWQAIRQLVPVLARIETPLVFSNGDYNPANFLSDGLLVTGFVDFEMACFEDPHYGFAKYRVYDMFPFHQAGLVERYLEAQGLSEAEFAPRVAVRCLWTLQREIPIFQDGSTPQNWSDVFAGVTAATNQDGTQTGTDGYRRHVLMLLQQSLASIT